MGPSRNLFRSAEEIGQMQSALNLDANNVAAAIADAPLVLPGLLIVVVLLLSSIKGAATERAR